MSSRWSGKQTTEPPRQVREGTLSSTGPQMTKETFVWRCCISRSPADERWRCPPGHTRSRWRDGPGATKAGLLLTIRVIFPVENSSKLGPDGPKIPRKNVHFLLRNRHHVTALSFFFSVQVSTFYAKNLARFQQRWAEIHPETFGSFEEEDPYLKASCCAARLRLS